MITFYTLLSFFWKKERKDNLKVKKCVTASAAKGSCVAAALKVWMNECRHPWMQAAPFKRKAHWYWMLIAKRGWCIWKSILSLPILAKFGHFNSHHARTGLQMQKIERTGKRQILSLSLSRVKETGAEESAAAMNDHKDRRLNEIRQGQGQRPTNQASNTSYE